MVRIAKGRVWVSAASVLALAGLVVWVSGCGDSASNEEAKVTITSVDGDGNAPNEIETMLIVRGTNFEDGDEIEICDADTGVRRMDGTSGTTYVSGTELQLGVDPPTFPTGKTKTFVSRKGVPKAIKGVTYLSGPTYIPGPGIDVAAGDIIQTKLSATDGLANDLGGGDELGIAAGGIDAPHLGQMGATDGQVLTWNAGGGTWETSDLAAIAENDTLQSVCDRGNTLTGDMDVTGTVTATAFSGDGSSLTNIDSASHSHTLAGDVTGPTGTTVVERIWGDPVVLGSGPADGDVLKWNDTLSQWEPAADAGGAPEADTLQTVCDRGRTAWTLAGGSETIYAENTSSDDYSKGIRGRTSAASGITYGVCGESDSTAGRGVYGESPFTGVSGQATAVAGANYGVRGQSSSATGYGVYGQSPYVGVGGVATGGGSVFGVYGYTGSASGRGVYGHAGSGTGVTYGVYGQSDSDSGYGVYATGTNVGLYAKGGGAMPKAAEFSGRVEVTAGAGTYPIDATYTSGTGAGHIRLSDTNALGETVDVRMGTNNNNGAVGTYSAHHLDLWAGGAPQVRIEDTGDVGIGTTTPGAKLDVAGGSIRTNNQLVSTVATGTAPLQVTSTTTVANLDADTVDGAHAGDFVRKAGDTMTGMLMVDTTDQYSVNVDNDNAAAAPTWGVYARADGVNAGGTRFGVQGVASGGGTNYGVHGTAPVGSGYAVYANGDLHVTGAISTSATTRYYTIGAGGFIPSSSATNYTVLPYYYNGTLAGQLHRVHAAVNLPNGAVITEFAACFDDNDNTQGILVDLERVAWGTSGVVNIATCSTTVAETPGTVTRTATGLSDLVDNSARSYNVRASWTAPATPWDIRLRSVMVTYEITSPLP